MDTVQPLDSSLHLAKDESLMLALVKEDKSIEGNIKKEEDPLQDQSIAADEDDETELLQKEIYLPYEHKDWVAGSRPHPGNIVEPASLALVNSVIEPDYDLTCTLPRSTVEDGKLSSLQLESIYKAATRHRIVFPNGERAGFFIGDAAGVGKGRQISGIIMDNYCRGRKRHIWFSVSTDLLLDAKRDLTDIGCFINVIDGCKEIDKGTKAFGLCDSVRSGVVFSTYSTLVSSSLSGAMGNVRKTRLQQLIDWCGGTEFDGCLVFDECHKAKTFIPGAEQRGSKIALAVCSIQRALPKARVLYCSATGVTDIKNMAFMERLGLWGFSSAFKNYQNFLDTIQKKGLGIAEMLAMDMKREGMYVSRMLSFSDAEFYHMECQLSEDQKLMYNMAAHVWNETRKSLLMAINRCNCTTAKMRIFWSQHQRFFQQMCMSIKVDMVVEHAKKAIEAGKCVVIGLQNTGEANLESRRNRDGDKNDFLSSCREILINFLNNHFPVEVEISPQNLIKKPDPWSIQAREMLLQYARQLNLCENAIDILIDKLGGPSQVAEMTGRRGRMVRDKPSSAPRYEIRKSSGNSEQGLNVAEKVMFMSGKKLIAIISDAASTGISLHADRNCKNQRQRVHITLQLPWSAEKAVQQLGRSHRSNQTSGPIYCLISTELGGERRFAASVARRLQSLGALTKGDRRAATVADLSQFNYDTIYGRAALRLMYTKICQGQLPEDIAFTSLGCDKITFEEFIPLMKECIVTMGLLTEQEVEVGKLVSEEDSRDVNRFLNRILGLQVVLQNLIFNYFMQCLDIIINIAKKEGKFNEGLVDLAGSYVKKEGESVAVFTDLTHDSWKVRIIVDRGLPWQDAFKRYESYKGKSSMSGFYRTKYPVYNRFFYLLLTPKDEACRSFRIARPNTGVSVQEVDKQEIKWKYDKVSLETAETEWNRMYDSSLVTCNHGYSCQNPQYCQVGLRQHRRSLICGSLLKVLPVLEQTIYKHAAKMKLSKYDSVIKIVRVKLDGGERLIGIQFPEILMPLAEMEAKALLLERQHSSVGEYSFVKEPIASVQPKMFIKATEPPQTLLNYFTATKPRVKDITGSFNCSNTTLDISMSLSVSDQSKRQSNSDDSDDDIICVLEKSPSKRKSQQKMLKFINKKPKPS